MRFRRIVYVGLVATAFAVWPSPAFAPPIDPADVFVFTRSPIGGPPNTDISISGRCRGATTGEASLIPATYSTAVPDRSDRQTFTPDSEGRFTVHLTNLYGHFEFPTDAEVAVSCRGASLVQPFEGGDSEATTGASVFTAVGDGPCGYAPFTPGFSHPGFGCPAHVKGFRANGAIADANFYVATWQWGASVTVADFNRDGRREVVHGTGPHSVAGFGVTGLSGTASYQGVASYHGFDGGVMVAVGDVNDDGAVDVVTGPGPGGGPHVKVFTLDTSGPTAGRGFHEIAGFMAYGPAFTGGVNVAVGDVDGDGRDDIVTGAGPGGGPHVRVFDGVGNPKAGFYAYDAAFAGGVNVASANVVGDVRDEIVTGAGAGGGPHVRVFVGDGSFSDTGFMAYSPEMGNGVYVAAGHIGTAPRIVTGPGRGANPHVKIFSTDGNQAGEGTKFGGFMAYGGYKAGVRVAVTP